ncbi:MAG: hypothetical protein ACM3ZV_04540 [Bacillota bacterium]
MAHGYLGDGYGIHGDSDERGDERDRSWRDRDSRERGEHWRDRDRERDRGMFSGRERGWSDEDRWSERGYGRQQDFGGFRGDYDRGREQGGFSGSGEYREGRRSFSAHPDDHYRSWRERHMSELDRDYEDYCREREQRFHQDFDSWRQQRHANYQPLRTGMTNSGMSHDPEGGVQVATEGLADETNGDPMGDATLGTNSSASTRRGRG